MRNHRKSCSRPVLHYSLAALLLLSNTIHMIQPPALIKFTHYTLCTSELARWSLFNVCSFAFTHTTPPANVQITSVFRALPLMFGTRVRSASYPASLLATQSDAHFKESLKTSLKSCVTQVVAVLLCIQYGCHLVDKLKPKLKPCEKLCSDLILTTHLTVTSNTISSFCDHPFMKIHFCWLG